MKKIKFKIVVILVLISLWNNNLTYGQNAQTKSDSEAKHMLTPEQWKADIDFLVKRLEIMHPDLYANVSKEEFNKCVNELYVKAQAYSDVNMYLGIMELVKLIRDGHTWVSWGEGNFGDSFHLAPISVFMFSDGLFITSAINKYSSIVGKKIVKVGSVTTEEFMQRRSKIKSGENKYGELLFNYMPLDLEWLRYLNILGANENFRFTLEDKNGTISEVEIEPVSKNEYYSIVDIKFFPLKNSRVTTMNEESQNPKPLYLSHLDSAGYIGDKYWYVYLPEHEALYVQINQCVNKNNDPFNKFYQRMFKTLDEKGAKRLIVDVRNNEGGDHYEQPLLLGIIERPNINKAENLFLITGRNTFSAAQHLVNQLTRYTNITTFGEPTGAKPNFFGAQKGFSLPNSTLYVAVSTKFWQDSSPDDYRILTEPDFFVPLSSTTYSNNLDPVIAFIFNYDSYKNLRPEFAEKMTKAYKDGGIEELRKVFVDIKPNYTKYGFNMENLLYKDLDDWMSNNSKSNKDYIAFLRFLHQELPNSVNVCWNLAARLNRPESREERISLYKKCLEINSGHRLVKMQLELLELERETSACYLLQDIFYKSGFNAMVSEYQKLRLTKNSKRFFLELEFNNWGYTLLNEKKYADAIEVFKINTETFPSSANAFDSLAEAYMTAGNKDLAIKNYEKSLELNPQNTNAVEQLKKVRN